MQVACFCPWYRLVTILLIRSTTALIPYLQKILTLFCFLFTSQPLNNCNNKISIKHTSSFLIYLRYQALLYTCQIKKADFKNVSVSCSSRYINILGNNYCGKSNMLLIKNEILRFSHAYNRKYIELYKLKSMDIIFNILQVFYFFYNFPRSECMNQKCAFSQRRYTSFSYSLFGVTDTVNFGLERKKNKRKHNFESERKY